MADFEMKIKKEKYDLPSSLPFNIESYLYSNIYLFPLWHLIINNITMVGTTRMLGQLLSSALTVIAGSFSFFEKSW